MGKPVPYLTEVSTRRTRTARRKGFLAVHFDRNGWGSYSRRDGADGSI